MTAAELIDTSFLAYNGRRLREACRLFAEKMLEPDVVVGMSITGALTPAGLGMSCLIPLIENGFVDWAVSTGANLYHDTHFALGLKMFQGIGRGRRRGAAQGRRGQNLRHLLRLPGAALDRRLFPSNRAAGGVPASDEQRGIPSSRGPLRGRARARAQAAEPIDAGSGAQHARCRFTLRRPATRRSE